MAHHDDGDGGGTLGTLGTLEVAFHFVTTS